MHIRRIVPGLAILICACDEVATRPSATPAPPPAPALIQVENSVAARPQSGLSLADVVYEYLTEGGISRFSAIYLHPPTGRVGPIRSARLVTITLTQRYGGVLMYSGASTYVEQRIEQSGVPRFTETTAKGGLFRVTGREAPHNLYTDGDRVAHLLSQAHAPSIMWRLWTRSASSPRAGKVVARFTVPISFAEEPTWTFDPTRAGYSRTEPDSGPFIDADTGRSLVAATVIVEQVDVTVAPEVEDVSGAHGVEQDIISGGAAQVFTGGREYDATWSQASTGPAAFRLKDGSSAPIAPGLVWIELVASGNPARAT